MTFRRTLGAFRRVALSRFNQRLCAMGSGGPFVSFTFDDFPRTACTNGGIILGKHGVRGTYYVSMGLVGTSNELGEQFTLADLRGLAGEGHEIGSHTLTHISSREVSARAFEQDAEAGQLALRGVFPKSSVANFAYPYGEATLAAKRSIGKRMASCRGTLPGLNGPLVDLNLLKANPIYGSNRQLENLQLLIELNENRKGWLIFYTHDVSANPSRYGCDPFLLDALVVRACSNGSTVAPVGEVLARISDSQ
jgi:peptidoglycan/xylan/chitin deacetylase (PgdA/CDA1 family)